MKRRRSRPGMVAWAIKKAMEQSDERHRAAEVARIKRRAAKGLREAIEDAECHAVQMNDDLDDLEEQAINHVTELLALALKTLDGVESLRSRD